MSKSLGNFANKVRWVLVSLPVLFLLTWQIALAQGGSQAFGVRNVTNVKGVQSKVWTAQQVSESHWKASPVGVCAIAYPCPEPNGFVETGYVIGNNVPNAGRLQQYVAWRNTNGQVFNVFGVGSFLNNNTWYRFGVYYSSSLSRWRALRDGASQYTFPATNFAQGGRVSCGAEAELAGQTIAVECEEMQYYKGGVWTSYDYTITSVSNNYCVFRPQQYGALGWGLYCAPNLGH